MYTCPNDNGCGSGDEGHTVALAPGPQRRRSKRRTGGSSVKTAARDFDSGGYRVHGEDFVEGLTCSHEESGYVSFPDDGIRAALLGERFRKWRLEASAPEAAWPPTYESLKSLMNQYSLIKKLESSASPRASEQLTPSLSCGPTTAYWPTAWVQYMSRCLKASRSSAHPERAIGKSAKNSGVALGKRPHICIEESSDGASKAEPGYHAEAAVVVSYLCANLGAAVRLAAENKDSVCDSVPIMSDYDAYFLLILTKDFAKEIGRHLAICSKKNSNAHNDSIHFSLPNSGNAQYHLSPHDAYMLVLEALDAFSTRCGRYRPIATKCAALASEIAKVHLNSSIEVLNILALSTRSIVKCIYNVQAAAARDITVAPEARQRSACHHFLDAQIREDSVDTVTAPLLVPLISSLARALRGIETLDLPATSTTEDGDAPLTALSGIVEIVGDGLNRLFQSPSTCKASESSIQSFNRVYSSDHMLQGLAEDDSALITFLLHLFDVFSRLSALAASLPDGCEHKGALSRFISLLNSIDLDPLSTFVWFIREALCADATVLLDLVTSTETEALLYLLRICKLLCTAPEHLLKSRCIDSDFNNTERSTNSDGLDDDESEDGNNPTVSEFMSTFIDRLQRMQRAGLLPFNSAPLINAAGRAIARIEQIGISVA